MTTIVVPYHQDERLPDESIPLPPDGATVTVDASLPDGSIWPRLTTLYDEVARTVADHTGPDAMPVVISGDCLVALGTIVGTQRAGMDPSIVWFDAHGDVHTLQTSTSGYLGGMALSLAMGRHPERLAEPLGLRPLSEQQAVLVDARDLDPAEADFLSTSELKRYPVDDLSSAVLPGGALILHIDVDVIDIGELPGVRFPAPDGPSKDTVLAAARRVLQTGRVVALDISCPWNPAADQQDVTIRTALIEELIALR
ncbi:arginase family protein [Kribbella sp. NPDC058245]|uniref:arginase family protein n=1 Tax=Kribbella sp. NPDC058245 TaxID=3346399 RepID=UPI0036E22527